MLQNGGSVKIYSEYKNDFKNIGLLKLLSKKRRVLAYIRKLIGSKKDSLVKIGTNAFTAGMSINIVALFSMLNFVKTEYCAVIFFGVTPLLMILIGSLFDFFANDYSKKINERFDIESINVEIEEWLKVNSNQKILYNHLNIINSHNPSHEINNIVLQIKKELMNQQYENIQENIFKLMETIEKSEYIKDNTKTLEESLLVYEKAIGIKQLSNEIEYEYEFKKIL